MLKLERKWELCHGKHLVALAYDKVLFSFARNFVERGDHMPDQTGQTKQISERREECDWSGAIENEIQDSLCLVVTVGDLSVKTPI